MRLGQLARQLDIKPDKIVSFLEKEKNITIKSHPNCKVEDELIEDISNHFKPVVVAKEEVITKKTEESVKVESTEEAPVPVEHIETQKVAEPQELKIIGKIDLPNKKDISVEVDGVVYDQETLDEKKKEELKAERERKEVEKEAKKKEDAEKRKLAKEKREVEAERQAMLATEKSNLLSKEAERKKAIVLKEQKEREAKLEKKRKVKQADHYSSQFSSTAATKKKKKKGASPKMETQTEATIEQHTTKETVTAEPVVEVQEKSIYKRFIKWLNT